MFRFLLYAWRHSVCQNATAVGMLKHAFAKFPDKMREDISWISMGAFIIWSKHSLYVMCKTLIASTPVSWWMKLVITRYAIWVKNTPDFALCLSFKSHLYPCDPTLVEVILDSTLATSNVYWGIVKKNKASDRLSLSQTALALIECCLWSITYISYLLMCFVQNIIWINAFIFFHYESAST